MRHEDSKLSFLTNASRIYEDYIHFLVARGKINDALRWADNSRARTLAEGLGLLRKGASTEPAALNAQEISRRAGGALLFIGWARSNPTCGRSRRKRPGCFRFLPAPQSMRRSSVITRLSPGRRTSLIPATRLAAGSIAR